MVVAVSALGAPARTGSAVTMILAWLAGVALALFPSASSAAAPAATANSAATAWIDTIESQASGLRPEVLRLALSATECAGDQGLLRSSRLVTVIDYSLPSVEPRLWVVDRISREVIAEELVAHGKHSGDNRTVRFSNTPDSLQTSLGLFVTDDTYVGSNGYSLRLDGLEAGVNDRARERAIVMHGAPYVNPATAKQLGRLGRSWGCPALSAASARRVIDTIKGGTAVFAYYPDAEWLGSSRFLNGCAVRR
jgi:L,D-transpeptidase catalytic domain